MARNKEYVGYVTETCKKCKRAFMYFDKMGDINDEPTKKFYCPECEKDGLKNKKTRETPDEFLKANNITDKIIKREFKKINKTRGKRRSYDSILKEAIEVAEYYKGE